MKRVFSYLIIIAGILCSCTDRIQFETPHFVSIQSESGMGSSTVISTADNLVLQYPVRLVSTTRPKDLVVEFDVTTGDGVSEGVNFTLPAKRSVTFSKGEYIKYIRINYKNHLVDETKDNTLVITLTSASDPDVILGYPGPSKKFSSHTVTFVND